MTDLSDIHGAFAAPIAYSGAGIAGAQGQITGIRCDVAGEQFQGHGRTVRHVWFEIRQADLPRRPRKGDGIVEADGAAWSVIDITDRDDVGAWEVTVERA